jgi:hypothetical protein
MSLVRRLRAQHQATIDRLEARLANVEAFEEIARAIHERTVAHASETGDLELAYRLAVADVEAEQRQSSLLAAFDQLSPQARFEVLASTFDDDEMRALLASRREMAEQRERARRAHVLDLRALRGGHLLGVGLFQRHRVDSGLHLGRRSDFCSRELTLETVDDGAVRVVADRLLLRGAYDGTSEYARAEWEREALADHSVVRVGVTVTDGRHDTFETKIYPGSRLDVDRGDAIVRTRLSVGFVEIDGEDLFTSA